MSPLLPQLINHHITILHFPLPITIAIPFLEFTKLPTTIPPQKSLIPNPCNVSLHVLLRSLWIKAIHYHCSYCKLDLYMEASGYIKENMRTVMQIQGLQILSSNSK